MSIYLLDTTLASPAAFADTIDWYGMLTGTLADGTKISGAFTIAITPQEYDDYLNVFAQLQAGANKNNLVVNWPDIGATVVSDYPLFNFQNTSGSYSLPVVDAIDVVRGDHGTYIDGLTGYTMTAETVHLISGPFDVPEPQ